MTPLVRPPAICEGLTLVGVLGTAATIVRAARGGAMKLAADEVVYGQWKLFRDYQILKPAAVGGRSC